MGTIRASFTCALLLLNVLPLIAVSRAIRVWVPKARRRSALAAAVLAILALNLPLVIFWVRSAEVYVFTSLPSVALRALFQPSLAWFITALLCTLILAPAYVLWATVKAAGRLARGTRSNAPSRRSLLAGGAGLLVPAAYGATAFVLLRSFDEVDVSPEMAIPMAGLPRALDGLTIAHLTDLHVGPYVRQREVERWVSLVNQLRADLVVLTGDLIDRSVNDLPDLVAGLRGLRSSQGVLAVLGNHDLTSDPRGPRGEWSGGENIVRGLETVGVRTLRNGVAYLGTGGDRLAVLGLDWVNPLGSRNFYQYRPAETRSKLDALSRRAEAGIPRLLLVHHPDTFTAVPAFRIGLTLAGHTHGGGQVVFRKRDGVPEGLFSSRFIYPGGLFQERGCSLYVNRGLGYLGVPVRINCPPEISRFRLVRS